MVEMGSDGAEQFVDIPYTRIVHLFMHPFYVLAIAVLYTVILFLNSSRYGFRASLSLTTGFFIVYMASYVLGSSHLYRKVHLKLFANRIVQVRGRRELCMWKRATDDERIELVFSQPLYLKYLGLGSLKAVSPRKRIYLGVYRSDMVDSLKRDYSILQENNRGGSRESYDHSSGYHFQVQWQPPRL